MAVFLIQKTTNDWELSYNEGYSWESLGVKATGAQGEKGATGASGEQGEKGDKGEVGTSGADGKDGKYGIDGMVVPTVLGGTALAAEIIYLAISLIKKKRLL